MLNISEEMFRKYMNNYINTYLFIIISIHMRLPRLFSFSTCNILPLVDVISTPSIGGDNIESRLLEIRGETEQ